MYKPPENKRILVIGANSFLSKQIIERLCRKNKVTGMLHENSNNIVKGVEYLNISDLHLLNDDVDIVFIISAYVPSRGTAIKKEVLEMVNVILPEKVCAQFPKARIVYASSVSVYGDPAGVADENSSSVNASEYGESKLKGEKIVAKHLSFAIVRISSMYGEGMNETTFIPLIINSAINKNEIRLLGDGGRKQNYIHVSDVAEIFVRAAQEHSNNTYLAVGESSFSNYEVALMIKKSLSSIEIILEGNDGSPSCFYNGSWSYDLLNFKPVKKLTEGIAELIGWQQKK
jgi:nucleoside-diphosphate-sugar epimerase